MTGFERYVLAEQLLLVSDAVLLNLIFVAQLSESAHLSRTILSGPYLGLSNDESAIEFATVLQEQFSPMDSASSRTTKQINTELKRRGYEAAGVADSVAERYKSFQTSEQQFNEVLDHPVGACRRSDLVSSFFCIHADIADSWNPHLISIHHRQHQLPSSSTFLSMTTQQGYQRQM